MKVGVLLAVAMATCKCQAQEFSVHALLQSAVGRDLPTGCVGNATAAAWTDGFKAAVDTMMQRTKRTMQLGLTSVAQGVLKLIEEIPECGDSVKFKPLKEQAERLKVLASTRSLAGLDATVKYEPLKGLTLGGIDVHAELNALLVAWQMNNGPDMVGKALAKFLAEFSEDSDADAEVPSLPVESPTHRPGALQRTTSFWASLLNSAFGRLSDNSRPVAESCVADGTAHLNADKFDEAFGRMMQKSQRSMQAGLRILAVAVSTLLENLEEHIACQQPLRASAGAARLRAAASRLETLVGTRSLVNPGTKVKYEAMQHLNIGGVDVHLELNKLIGSWIQDKAAHEVGDSLADFFEDFREQEEEVEEATGELTDLTKMWSDAVSAAGGCSAQGCFQEDLLTQMAHEIEAAIELMLKKRRKTMQQGLKELADAVDKQVSAMPALCQECPGLLIIRRGSRKVRKLTRMLVVDYGTYIKYEALKSLEVGGVDVHSELNAFLVAWKLRGRREAGQPLGQLLQRFATITGHDEF
ncbi:unnamed protein product [Effrenium voratum]|uniref:Uncharacterized protein n=1 Tax=Effrenium voratum TaxID=2562239 RepID=A0AA36MIS0_9DINO|nr:unnamed protein product [Effrenium voratum]CAJ1423436.1 unnamed protein product [Effrenium voratum]